MNFIKQLFCKHNWHFVKDVDKYWTEYECDKCWKHREFMTRGCGNE